mmetsp:Transcript_11860/g.27469  ORF Transcript_11860/g.27469 Transcript_11860/m.27469 type:complete len:81 (+) Transcript_11860:1170-1412(+)
MALEIRVMDLWLSRDVLSFACHSPCPFLPLLSASLLLQLFPRFSSREAILLFGRQHDTTWALLSTAFAMSHIDARLSLKQ